MRWVTEELGLHLQHIRNTVGVQMPGPVILQPLLLRKPVRTSALW